MNPRSIALALTLPLAAGAPAAKAPKRYTIQQLMTTIGYSGAEFSHDESWLLMHSNASGLRNAYKLDLKSGAMTPLTASTQDPVQAVACFPKDGRVLFYQDQKSNELNHLFVRELNGTVKDLTPEAKGRGIFGGWTKDGGGFYLKLTERDPKVADLYLVDTDTYEKKLIFKNELSAPYILGNISPDGRWIALSKLPSRADSRLFAADLRSGDVKELLAHPGREVVIDPEEFTPDSKSLMVLTDDGADASYLVKVDLEDGRVETIQKSAWDITACFFSPSGRYRVTETNEDATTVTRVADLRTGKPLPLPKVPAGEARNLVFSPSESRAAFYVNGDRSPNNLWLWDLKTGKAKALTRSLGKEVDPEDLVDSRIVRFKSFDGTVIPSVFYLPKGASSAAKVPAIVYVHGGPGDQTRAGFNGMIQHLVNRGYAVLGINNRGSSGYGKSFYFADDRKHGREPLWDCIEAKSLLASMPEIDRERIGIMGASYGGYMVLAALVYRPEAFRAGVDMFGVSNWFRVLESLPPHLEVQRQALYKEVGHPEQDKEHLKAISPLFSASEVRVPLMVLQGAKDPRVPKSESDDMVAAVRKNGVPVDYLLFEDEGHGIRKRKNQELASERIIAFLDQHLKGAAK